MGYTSWPGGEVVVSKAGKSTHGLGRFYSNMAQRPISSVSFLALSLVDVENRRTYPLRVEQHLPVKAIEPVAPAPKRKRGRPKGSRNHAKTTPVLSPELRLLTTLVRATLQIILPLQVRHIVLDGFFGTYPATWMVCDTGLHLISKLRHNVALYLPYTGPKPRRGSTSRYGDKLDYQNLPATACVDTLTEGQVAT